MARVTVVIPAYNAAAYLGEALDSVAAQSFRDHETVVVDDGLSDATAEVAQSRPGVRLLRQPQAGPAGARNAGAWAGSGELIAFLDADDVWHPAKLERQLARLDRDPRAVLVVCPAVDLGKKERRPPAPLPEGDVTSALLRENFVVTSSVLVRRQAFAAVSGFDPALPACGEDYDLWLRLSLSAPFAALAEPLVKRRWTPGSASSDHLRLWRAALLAIEKFLRLPEAAPHAAAAERRRAELLYLVGRAHLSRGEREQARDHLRRAARARPAELPRVLPLLALALLPARALLGLHRLRDRRRR